ncbi:MAG: toll/interleukin-1 receptor domain-containing protein [Pseudomonadales bacterium]|nr:toll/interleukin-1 receptor domain-containing protein [Pseudomonadales bacterium]
MSFKVFISYSTRDLERVNGVRDMLEHSTIEVYIAEYSLDPGQPISDSIVAAIRDCDLFLLVWSDNAATSEWVPQEIGIAKSAKKTILPVVLEKGLTLPGFIRDLKYLDAYTDPQSSLELLQELIFRDAEAKQQREGLVWLGIGGALLWLLSK